MYFMLSQSNISKNVTSKIFGHSECVNESIAGAMVDYLCSAGQICMSLGVWKKLDENVACAVCDAPLLFDAFCDIVGTIKPGQYQYGR